MCDKKWIVWKIGNGLLECTCPECGHKKQIMHPTRDWTRCPDCMAVLYYDRREFRKKRL